MSNYLTSCSTIYCFLSFAKCNYSAFLIIGFTCEEHENPADFFLDTIIRYEKESHQQSQVTVLFSAPATAEELEEPQDVSIHLLTDASSSKKVKLAETYCKSVEYQDLRKRIDPMLQNVREEKKKETTAQRIQRTLCGQQSYATSVFWQVCLPQSCM